MDTTISFQEMNSPAACVLFNFANSSCGLDDNAIHQLYKFWFQVVYKIISTRMQVTELVVTTTSTKDTVLVVIITSTTQVMELVVTTTSAKDTDWW